MKVVFGALTLGVAVAVLLLGTFGMAGGAKKTAPQVEKEKAKGDLESFFTQLDVNKDGKLSKQEFVVLADKAQEKDKARQQLSQAFDKLDPANKGITKEQFQRFLDERKKAEGK